MDADVQIPLHSREQPQLSGRLSYLNASLLLSAISLVLATISGLAGRRVNYLDYLQIFNAMAALMLATSVAAFAIGTIGTWKERGQGASLWLADVLAVAIVALFLFDS